MVNGLHAESLHNGKQALAVLHRAEDGQYFDSRA